MRILFEGSAADTFSSIMTNDITAYLSLSIMVVTTGLVYYLLARMLDWSSNRPLPRVVQSPAFNLLLVSSALAIAFLLFRGIDPIGLLSIGTDPIVWIVDEYAPVVAVGLAGTIMLIVLQWLRAR
jgi:hypothetical protein